MPNVDHQAGLVHEALLYTSEEALADQVLPFIQEGIDAHEPVLVVAGPRCRKILRSELGSLVERLAGLLPAEDRWTKGSEVLQGYALELSALRRPGKPLRLVGEPVWTGWPEGREWLRYEAVVNHCFASWPYYSLCLYDRQAVPVDVIEDVARTHPLVSWDGRKSVSDRYLEPDRFLRAAEPTWERSPDSAPALRVTSFRQARAFVSHHGVRLGLGRNPEALMLASHELVANVVQHTGDTPVVSVWAQGDSLVCEVRDDGRGLDDPYAGYIPPRPEQERGRGLWMARCLADDLAVRSSKDGTTVRLYFRCAHDRRSGSWTARTSSP